LIAIEFDPWVCALHNVTKMEVAVNTRFLLDGQLEGLGRYTDEVLRRLVQGHPEVRFHFFFDRPYPAQFIYGPNVVPHVLFPPARHPVLWWLWFEWAVAQKIKATRPAVFFSPDGFLSLRTHTCPQVAVFHDLAFEAYPAEIDWAHRTYYRYFFPKYAHKAAALLAVSNFTRQHVLTCYGIASEKIQTAHNGSSEAFGPVSEAEKTTIRARYTQGAPYFLYAGAIQPRKNLVTLLQAFEAFSAQFPEANVRLVLTGRQAWNFEATIDFARQMQYRDRVVFTGYVTDAELNQLYAGSIALTYISRFEGFGLPVLEAMHAETALIVADASSLPEVAGDAALRIPPLDVPALTQALTQLWQQPTLRAQLIDKGRLQRTHFSWDHSASTVWDTLVRVANPSAKS
jgi:glycosyltransferase involved in cell wall biosynthesis